MSFGKVKFDFLVHKLRWFSLPEEDISFNIFSGKYVGWGVRECVLCSHAKSEATIAVGCFIFLRGTFWS